MLQDAGEGEDVLLGSFKLARDEEESTKRNENVTTPRPGPLLAKFRQVSHLQTQKKGRTHAGGEMRETSRERRDDLEGVETCGGDFTVHLDGGEGEGNDKVVAGSNERGHELDGVVVGGLVRDVDDHAEVLGAEEGGDVGLYLLEALLDPGSRLGEVRKALDLPEGSAKSVAEPNGEKQDHSLRQATMNVIERPSSLAEVRTERVP